MPKKTFKMTLGTKSIDRTVRELERYGRALSDMIYALLDAKVQNDAGDAFHSLDDGGDRQVPEREVFQ